MKYQTTMLMKMAKDKKSIIKTFGMTMMKASETKHQIPLENCLIWNFILNTH